MNPAALVDKAIALLEQAQRTAEGQRWHPGVYSHGVSAHLQLEAMQRAFELGPQS